MTDAVTEHDDVIRVELTVTGVVQAVGFRPFVYRRATAHDLGGSVRNTGDAGVDIVLEGPEDAVDAFLTELRERPPPLSVVESIEIERRESIAAEHRGSFEIAASTDDDGGSGTIPPDTGICDACLADLHDAESRYHGYWATSCVDCGPRYTVIEALPYDRPRTTMAEFPLCKACHEEYTDPTDRRYHAQTIACPDCGPSLSLLDRDREARTEGEDAIAEASRRLTDGEILAVRGIGGTHLACLATDTAAVTRLRERTDRPGKPFALMAESVEAVERFARVGDEERTLLSDVRRPIVVLETATDPEDRPAWLETVAPGLHTVGVMLPYAGLHHLLFERLEEPLVMTSANRPGEPMALTVDAIYESLDGVIDAALVHDREIAARCDDSVVRVVDGTRRFVRRSRGWVPRPLPRRTTGPTVLAFGAEFDNTVAIARDDEVLVSQHLGDVDGPETERFLQSTVRHLTELFGADPELVACDLHPEFLTSKLADAYADRSVDRGGETATSTDGVGSVDDVDPTTPIRVQHHHAHAAGLLGEHDRDRGIVITIDGTGYGPDETIWGGEILDATRGSFERVGGLGSVRLPGGEAAVRRPARILAGVLEDDDRVDRLLAERAGLSRTEAATVRESVEAGVNAPETTSAGRYLDATSALLNVCTERRYQGEPAIRLEAAAATSDPVEIGHERGAPADEPGELSVPYTTRDGTTVIDTPRLLRRLDRLHETRSSETVAATAQAALAEGVATIAVRMASDRDVPAVGVTGGVAYNEAISRRVRETVERAGLQFIAPTRVPPGDAGIAYGQAIVASARANGRSESERTRSNSERVRSSSERARSNSER